MGRPMDLNFQLFETATLFITVLVVAFMLQVSESAFFFFLLEGWGWGCTYMTAIVGKDQFTLIFHNEKTFSTQTYMTEPIPWHTHAQTSLVPFVWKSLLSRDYSCNFILSLQEGTANYLKGLMLILCYLIVAASFFVHIDPTSLGESSRLFYVGWWNPSSSNVGKSEEYICIVSVTCLYCFSYISRAQKLDKYGIWFG